MLAGTPWRNQIGVGQHTLFSFFFFLLAVWLSELSGVVLVTPGAEGAGGVDFSAGDRRKLRTVSGLCFAVAYFKYTLTAPLALYFVYKRKWKELIVSVIPHIIGTFAAAFVLGEPVKNMLIKPLRVSMALSGEGSLDIGAFMGGGRAAMIMSLAIMVFLLVLSFIFPQGRDEIFFSIVLLFSLILTYHRTYDFFVLVAVFSGIRALTENLSGGLKNGIYVFYAALIFIIFFGLRIFHESPAAICAAAVVYYIFTAAFTVMGFRKYG